MPRKRIPDVSCRYVFTLINNKDNDIRDKNDEKVNSDIIALTTAKRIFQQINVTQHGYSEATVQSFFAAMDANDSDKDGFLNYQEFRSAFNVLKGAD